MSRNKADHYIRTGRAVMQSGQLHLIWSALEQAQEYDVPWEREVFFWNGDTANKRRYHGMFKPGEVRS